MKQLLICPLLSALLLGSFAWAEEPSKIVHDAEYYVLEAQNGEKWAAEDGDLNQKLAELEKKHGARPNIVHIMWDDTAYGDVGIPAIQKNRGLETPNLNQMAREGILFTRMYTEVGCTPSRAACMTGRHPIRNAMYNIGMLREMHGLRASETTLAEVVGNAGYATAFHGKWHLGDIEESYAHNQGFDEAFFTGYNQILSLWTRNAEQANATMGLFEDMLPEDPYKLDDTFITKGWAMVVEGTKGGATRQWEDNSYETYLKIDAEAQRRTLDFIERKAKAGKPFYVANWPMMSSFLPSEKKVSASRSLLQDGLQNNMDPFVGKVMTKLQELGIAENTLLVCMADNGPMSHNPPPGCGFAETMFRGGKGDFLEGGVRVPAQAWWPGVIDEGQIVGDIIHEADLFTTFARLAGATNGIPGDRVIDGIDQTALLLNGDTHSRRDYVFIVALIPGQSSVQLHQMNKDPPADESNVPTQER